MFLTVIVFLWAVQGSMAVNRWWTESPQSYLENTVAMTLGFIVFSLLASRSRLDFIGFLVLGVAIYYLVNYEIGGPSKMYFTPFDPLLGIDPVFENGSWMGILSIDFRRNLALIASMLAAFILTVSYSLRLKVHT